MQQPSERPAQPTAAEEPKRFSGGFVASAFAGGILTGLLVAVLISIFVGGTDKATPAAGSKGRSAAPTSSPQASGSDTRTGSGTGAGSENRSNNDVQVSCETGVNPPSATVVVTNSSTKPSDYVVTVAFVSSDGQSNFGDAVLDVRRLDPGESSAPRRLSATASTSSGDVTCQLQAVTRLAS